MYELLGALPPNARVLDIGSAQGSFNPSGYAFNVVRIDREYSRTPGGNAVRADAAALPFPQHCFDLIISNHSLEHFDNLGASLSEMGRIVKPNGAIYIAVPDASTATDRLYRWLAKGGGHVNAFTSAGELGTKIERATGLKHAATRTLHTSLSFLNRRNHPTRAPRRLLLVGGGTEISLHILSYLSRVIDSVFRTRLSVYGWALYFGNLNAEIELDAWTNVCVRCGSGHPAKSLCIWGLLKRYRCPSCGAVNLFR